MSQRTEELGAIHGETQRFECQVIGYPTPTVTWFKDEVNISENLRYQIDYNQEQGTIALIIRNVNLADEGLYLCKAENSEGHATTTAYLVVKVDPSSGSAKDYSSMTIEKLSEEEHSQVEVLKSGRQTIIEEVITRVEESEREEIEEKSVAPKIICDQVFARDLSLKVGATIAFEVNIRGYPRPNVSWFVGNTKLEDSSRVSVEVREGASSLKVRSVTGEDAGTYKVMAENALGLDTATFKVIVKAPPSPPQNLCVVEVSKDYVVITWEPPTCDGGEKISGYEVEKSLDGMIFVSAGYVDSSVLRHKIIRLHDGYDYIFRVSAENRIGLGDPVTLEKPVTCKLPFDPPSQPRNLTVIEHGKDYIMIGWSEPEINDGSEIIQYVVEKCDATRGSRTWVVVGTVGPSEKTFRALRLFQGNLYLFRVVAENQAGPGPSVELAEPVMAKLPYDTPGAPRNVRVKDYWSDSITITWEAPEHDGGSPITGYLIEQRDALYPKWAKAASLEADVFHYKAGNLLEGTDYMFQVFAVNKLGPGTEAGQLERPCKAKMPFDPPFAPAHVEVTDYGTNHVTLSWSAPEHNGGSPIIGYIIERYDALVGIWTQVAKTEADVIKATVADLFEGQSYLFRVAALNQCGQGLYAATTTPVMTLLPYSKPSKPQNLRVLNTWRDYVMIGWDEPSDDGGCPLTGFTVEQRGIDETGFKFVAAVGGNVTQHQISNLLEGHEYFFRVFAQNSIGLSDQAAELWSPVKTSLPCELPSVPLNVHVTETGNGLISIAWEAPKTDGGAPISAYLVETCLSVSTNWRRAGLVDGNTMSFNLTGLVEGDYYFVRVYSENEAGRSRRAAEILEPVRAKQPSKVPGPPANLRVAGVTASSVTVSWDMPRFDGVSDATQYIIDVRESGEAEYAAAGRVDGRINYFTLENLDKGKQYYFRVRSKNSAGFCETSAELDSPIQPQDTKALPLPPESFQVSEVTDSSLRLSWTSTQQPTRYMIEQRDGLNGPFFLVATPVGSTTSIVMENLIPSQPYSFRIWSEEEGRRSETCAQVSTKQTSTKRDVDQSMTRDEVDFCDRAEIVQNTESGFQINESVMEVTDSERRKREEISTSDNAGVMQAELTEVRKMEQLELEAKKQVDPKLEPVHISKIKQVEQGKVMQVEPAEKQDFVKTLKQDEQIETREEEQAKAKLAEVYQAGKEELKAAEQVEQIEVEQLKQAEAKNVEKADVKTVEEAEIKQVELGEVKQEEETEIKHVVEATVKQVDEPEIKKVEKTEVKLVEQAKVEVEQAEVKQVKQPEVKQVEEIETKEVEPEKLKQVEPAEAKEVEQAEVKHVEQAEVKKVEQAEIKQVEQKEAKKMAETEVRHVELPEARQVDQAEVKPCERVEQTEMIHAQHKDAKQAEAQSKEETEVKPEEPTEAKEVEQTEVKQVGQAAVKDTEQTAVKPVAKQDEEVNLVEKFTELEKRKSNEEKSKAESDLRLVETEEESSEEEYFEDAVVEDTESEIADSSAGGALPATDASHAQILAAGESESVTKKPTKDELLVQKTTNLTEELCEVREEAAHIDAMQIKQDAEVKVTTEGASASNKEQTGLNEDKETELATEHTSEKEIKLAEEHTSLSKLPTHFSHLSVQQVTSDSVALSWDPPKDTGGVDVLSYLIVMRDGGKNKYKKVGQVVGSHLTYEVSSLKEGREYWFRVFAENSFGISKEFADMEAPVKIEKKKKEKKSKEKLVVEGQELNKEEKETFVGEILEEVTITTNVEKIVEEVSLTAEEKVASWLESGRVADDAPLFDPIPDTVLVEEGETIRLPCKTKGQPPPEVKFYKGEERLKPRKKDKKLRLSYDVTDDIFVMEILNATVEDAGVYHVKAANKTGCTEAQVIVKVTVKAVKSEIVSEIGPNQSTELEEEKKDHVEHVSSPEPTTGVSNVLESSQTVVDSNNLTQNTVKEDSLALKSQLAADIMPDLETSLSTISAAVEETSKQTDVKEELVITKKLTSEVSSELNVESRKIVSETDYSVKEDEKHKALSESDVKAADEQIEISKKQRSDEIDQRLEGASSKAIKVTKEDQRLKESSEAEHKREEKADQAINVEYTEEDVAVHLPVFEVKPEPVTVNEGEIIRLTWKISQDSKSEFGWTKNGKKLKTKKDKRIKVGFDATTGKGVLEIVGADLNDIGEYALNVENEHGRIIQVVFVNVVSKSEGKPPKLDEYPKPQIVSEGQAFEVSCQVSGEPPPEVEFFKNGRPVDNRDSRVTISRTKETCKLQVTDAISSDSGKYTVTATNERGRTSHTVSVDVQGTDKSVDEKKNIPEFLTKLVPVKAREGEAVKLSIAVKDSDDTNVLWFKDGRPLISEGNLKIGREENIYYLEIEGSTVQDSGEYTCTANSVGGACFCTASVEVTAPTVEVKGDQHVPEKDTDLMRFETVTEKIDKDQLDSPNDTQKDSHKDSQKDRQSSDEEMEEDVEQSHPLYMAVTKYTSTEGQGLDVEEDEIVEVLNAEGSEMWLCRKPEHPEKHGWIPAHYLIAKSEATKLDTRSTQEVFREDVIKITNKQQEAIMKRRYALKDLWESERDYVRDLNFTMESYHGPFQQNTPNVFAGRTDVLFSSLPSLLSFHDKFLDEIMNCSNDPDSLASCFLNAEQSFQLYIPYLKTRQEADQILDKENAIKFLKGHNLAIGNVGEQKLSLPHYLQRPSNRLHEYTTTLKDFIRYSVRANQNTAQLEKAVVMLESLRKKADDQLLVDRITNYDGVLTELGPVLCHENFSVWRDESSGKAKDCRIFLFKDKLLITRKRKSDTPTYECKTVLNLKDVLINELGDRRFELRFEDQSRGKYTFQAKLAPVSDAWCQLLAPLVPKWGRKCEFRTKADDITCKEGAPVHITFSIYGQPLPDVSWYFDGQPIIPNGDYKIMSDGCQHMLSISSVAVSMGGRYSAKAKNPYGEEELGIRVTVEEDLIEPKFTSELRNCDVLLGADAKFSVKISGKPLPTVKWFRDGVELAESARLKLLPVDSQTQILILTQVEESDIGLYECRAESKAGVTSSKAKLNITDLEERKLEEAPEFITALRDTLTIEGNETQLTVSFSGRPAPEVRWFYDGKDIAPSNEITLASDTQNALLTIKSTRPEHSGRYSCCLSNRFGSVEVASVLSVASPPLLTGDFGNQERHCGETASFVCSFKSLPRPDVTWCQNGQELAESDRIAVETTDSLTTLTIKNVEPSDEGDYSCHLVNAAGETICSAKLACLLKQLGEVDGSRVESRRPIFLKTIDNQEVVAGGLAKFCCEATGHPFSSIKWFKDKEEQKPTDHIQMGAKDGIAWLSISDVRDSDAGCYQCTLSNDDGETSSTALLNVDSVVNLDLDEVAEKRLKESKLQNVVPVMPFDKPLLKEIDLNTLEISWLPATLPPTARQTPISYVLERKDLGDVTSNWTEIQSSLAETVFRLTEYSPTKDYLYRVRAANQFGSSDPTLSVTYYGKSASEVKAGKPVYRECLPPKTPKDKPTITELKDDALKISWQASELPAGAAVTEIWYIVERRCPPSKNWIEIASEIKDTEYEMHDYRPEKDYMFRIRAGNEYGMSDPSMSATLFTKPPESSKPMRKKDSDEYKSKVKPRTIFDKPEIVDMLGTALTLRWKPSSIPPYAVQTRIWYIVEQRIPPDTEWTKIATDLCDTEMRIKYSAANDYYFRVRAANEFGIAEPSMPVMLRKKEGILESEEELLAKKRKEKAEKDFLTTRRVPDHLRVIPEFLGTPDDTQYGVEGRTSEVVLRLRAYPEPKVTWNFHNTWIEMGDKYTSSLSGSGELVLQIHDFSWSEVGEYKVIIENEFGAATRTIKIDMADPPTFLEPMKDQIFNLHQSGRLECRVHGIPYPTIQFKKDWRPVAGSHRIKVSREDFDHWSLNMQNAIRTDEGVYECIAENVAGKVYCTANVKIAEKSGMRRDIKFNGVATEEYFHVIDELGRGSYGVVRRVIDKNSGSQYAAKFLRYNDPLAREELAQELEMMSLLDHNNIVQVVDGYEDKKRLVIVMEIVTGGDLLQRLVSEDSLMESEAAFYLRQLLLAVEYMHAQNVIHLDLKPENLLLSSSSSDELKIIDFGFARRYNPNRKLRIKYASPEFCSPEVAKEECITPATDLWSVGVIAYILLTGVSPFYAESARQTLLKIQGGKAEFPSEIFAEISEVAQEFISKLLEKDPRRRMSATEAIEHPFLCLANHRGLGNRIGMDRHRAYMFRRKWERGSTVVRTIVQPKPLSTYMVEMPALEVDVAVPVLHMPGADESDRASLSGSIQLEAGASAMLQIMGPPSMMSATPSVTGSGSSSEWGREYEDEDTWYEYSSTYQTGPETHLFPSKDTGLSLRMAKYRRTSHSASASRGTSVRSLKERRDLRDLDKELDMEDPMPSRFVTRSSWQQKTMMMSSSEGYPPIFKEKIHDKAYCVGDPCTLKVRVIGSPQPIISWYRNDELLTEGGRVRVTCSDDGRHSLTILQTKPNDFGVYKSVARNKYGTVTCRARMLCGDHPSRPGRPHVTKISDREVFMIWEEPESDGNSYIQSYKVDWHRPGDDRWTTATYCIDECALIKRLRPDTSYRFRVSAINKFGPSPYSWASVEIRTKKKGASSLDVDSETKRILLRSRQATSRPSPEASPTASPFGSTEDIVEALAEEKAKESGLPCPEVLLQEADPSKHLQFGSEIWRGRFSIVLNVQPREGVKIKRVAKVSEFDPVNSERSLREYEVLKAVRQEHVIRLYEAFLWNNFVVLVFEKLYGENVVRSLSLKNRYTEYTVTTIVKQVLDALQFLHHHGIVHLNIQPDNVIMQSRRRFDVKLVDFGQAHKVTTTDGVKVSRIGTAEFMAPEKVTSENVGVAADVWGVGVLAFILLSGISPFYAETDEDTFSNIEHVRYDAHALYHNVTKFGLKFLFQTLRRNPKSRLTVEDCLDHRWLMLNQVMVKSRRQAIFSTDKLKFFLDDYITRRMRNAVPPKRIVETYGSSEESLWPASDDDDQPFFAVNISAAAKNMF